MELIELHAHFSACMRKETLAEFIQDKLGKDTDLAFLEDNSLQGVFKLFTIINSINLNLERVRRVAREIIADFRDDGVKYLELRATPKKGADFDQLLYLQTIAAVMEEEKQSIEVNLIVSIDRAKGLEEAEKTYKMLKQNKVPRLVGVDLCGHPGVSHFNEYRGVLEKFRKMGLKITVHAGELPESVKENEDVLEFAPDRIGHFIYFTKEQLRRVRELGIPIEVCFTSNLCTTALASQEHPVQEFLASGVPVAICTDDTLCFRTSVSKEVQKVQLALKLSDKEMASIISGSHQYKFNAQ